MHEQSSPKLAGVLSKAASAATKVERAFLTVFVVYRYRNNIFHGNKGVDSWLGYREQIDLCTEVMQSFIAHFEQDSPTLRTPGRADRPH